MPQRLVEITSEYPGLLSSLVTAKQEPPYTIVEREGNYYLSFFDSDNPMNTERAEHSADVLVANINAILTLPSFKVANALKRTNHVITLDENGREIGKKVLTVGLRARVSPDFTNMDFSSFMEMEVKASRLSRIKQALWYYAGGLSWFNLYDVFETIRKDLEEVTGSGIPEQWTTDAQLRNRLDDFTESANNAFISEYAARHTFSNSYEIERISANLVRLKEGGREVMPMTLSEAGTFIENLLIHWLRYRGIRF
jgi:hypothetical protein